MGQKIGNKRWSIVLLLFLCYTILYMDRSIMSISGPSMMEHYGWTATQFGWATTAFFIGYMITQIIGGNLADRFGGGRVVIFGAIAWSIFVFLTPFGATLILMMIIRALMGMGEGVSLPAMHSILGKWVPKKNSGKPTGFIQAGVPFGMAITYPIATWIILTWNWQTVFWSFSFLAPVWCLIWWKFGKDRPEQHPTITKEELEYIKADNDNLQMKKDEPKLSNKEILSKGSIWVAAFPYFCANYLFYLFMTWLPTYFVKGRGIDLGHSALFSSLPNIIAICTYPLGGILADKLSKKYGQNVGRRIVPITGLLIAGIFLILATRASSVGSAAALITLSNAFLTLTMGSFFSMPMVFSQTNTGIITGMFTTLGTMAGILAPIVSGYIIDWSGHYEFALYVGATIAIIGAIVLLTVVRVKPINKTETIPSME